MRPAYLARIESIVFRSEQAATDEVVSESCEKNHVCVLVLTNNEFERNFHCHSDVRTMGPENWFTVPNAPKTKYFVFFDISAAVCGLFCDSALRPIKTSFPDELGVGRVPNSDCSIWCASIQIQNGLGSFYQNGTCIRIMSHFRCT